MINYVNFEDQICRNIYNIDVELEYTMHFKALFSVNEHTP
jgi:hypothetical protein